MLGSFGDKIIAIGIGLNVLHLLGRRDLIGTLILNLGRDQQAFLNVIQRGVGRDIGTINGAFGDDVRPRGVFIALGPGQDPGEGGGRDDAGTGKEFGWGGIQAEPVTEGGQNGSVVEGRFAG